MKDPEFIHGFSSSSENGGDSSDEDDSDVDMDAAGGEKSTIKAKDLPNVVEGDKEVQEKLGKAKKRSVSRGLSVVVVGVGVDVGGISQSGC